MTVGMNRGKGRGGAARTYLVTCNTIGIITSIHVPDCRTVTPPVASVCHHHMIYLTDDTLSFAARKDLSALDIASMGSQEEVVEVLRKRILYDDNAKHYTETANCLNARMRGAWHWVVYTRISE